MIRTNRWSLLTGRGLVIALVAALSGWQSAAQDATEAAADAPQDPGAQVLAASREFEPGRFEATIEAGEARYANLYAPESSAVWVTEEVDALRRAADEEAGLEALEDLEEVARVARAGFVVIACRLESAFGDEAIAYEAVTLRHVEVFLRTPSGAMLKPAQTIMETRLDESQNGALHRFSRGIVLVFPRREAMSGLPSIEPSARNVRLVFRGFNSEYFFEWPNANPAGAPAPDKYRRTRTAAGLVHTGFNEFYSKLRMLKPVFD